MAASHVQVIGLTRWSYPFQGSGLRQSDEDLSKLRSKLYAPARLNHRLFLLRHVLLPTLRAQTDPDFIHLFLIGDHLPQPWRDTVLTLLKTMPQIVPVIRAEGGKHRDLCREVISQHVDPSAVACAQYRLDDDDGLGADFVARTRALFSDLRTVFDTTNRLALDFTRGFILDSSGATIKLQPVSMRFWAPGLAVFQRPGSDRCVIDYNHLKIWHHMPCLTWQDAPMFIRGRHADNDSGLGDFGRRTRGFRFQHERPDAYFSRQFGLDLPALHADWPAHQVPPPLPSVDQPHAPLTGK